MKFPALFVLLLCLPIFSQAQSESATAEEKMELGIHFPGINNFGIIYKNQSSANSYWRYRIAAIQLNTSPSFPSANFQFNLALSAGYEKRKSFREKLELLYGPEMQIGYGGSNDYSTYFLGLGYVLGVQYDLAANFKIGLELIPILRYSYNGNNTNGFQDYLNLNATSQTAYLFIVHQF